MVDFQSRDTRRGPPIDDESESDSADSPPSNEDDDTEGAEDTAAENSADTDVEPATAVATETATEDTESADSDPLGEDNGSAAEPAAEDNGSAAEPAAEDNGSAAEPAAEDNGSAVEPAPEDHGSAVESAPEDPLADATTSAESTASAVTTDQTTTAARTSEAATPTRAVDVAVVTVSGDRAALEDSVTGAFEAAGHTVVRRERLRGGYDAIQQMVDTLVDRDAVDVVVTVGGVGLSADEMAIEAVHPLLEKALPGFGEAFRARLADHIGTGIVGVRSTAGISDGTLVFCLPGDAEAAELAVGEILATEAPILVDQLDG